METATVDPLAGMRGLPPGPELAAVLAGLDESVLDEGERLDVIAAWSRVRAWAEARELRVTAVVAGPPTEERPAAAALLGTRLHLPQVTAAERLDLAWTLATERPRTWRALHAGRMSLAHAKVILDEVRNLSALDAGRIELGALYDAPVRTAASLRRMLRRRVLAIDPDAQTRRHADAVKDRTTWFRKLDDGMAEFGARLPLADAIRCATAVDEAARKLRAEDDGRTADQRRADALVDLLTGGEAPIVEIIVRATDDQPVTIPGFGPLDTDSLGELVADSTTIVLRPLGGPSPACSTYRPSTALDRWIRATDPTCRFPHCTVKSADCDLDHVAPWHRGGTTCHSNLMPLCREHHRLKTFHHWTPILHADRSVTWTDPTGHEHHVPPPDD
jgi:hypothetical protein